MLRVLYKVVAFFSACTCIFILVTKVHILKYMLKHKLVNVADKKRKKNDKSLITCTTCNCN